MSHVLSELMGATEPIYTNQLRQLERDNGYPDVDVRLISYIAEKVRQKTKELGLDPNDTNGQELYTALQILTAKHNQFLASAIAGQDPDNVEEMLPLIINYVQKLSIPRNCWAIKASVAKRLLKDKPPKKVMKQLGYRSIDSMIKRENINELYAALRLIESTSWIKKFVSTYKQLTSSDFETRRIKIISLNPKQWGMLAQDFVYSQRQNVTNLKEMGIVVVLPMPVKRLNGFTIALLPLLLSYINEVRFYSAYFKLQQVKPNFGAILAATINSNKAVSLNVAGQQLTWRTMQRYFGRISAERHPEIFEPYVQTEDLAWKSAEETLYRLEPALKFWEDMDFVAAFKDGQPIPLGLADNSASFCNQLAYGKQCVYNFKDSLTAELYARYMEQDNLVNNISKQIDSDSDNLEISNHIVSAEA